MTDAGSFVYRSFLSFVKKDIPELLKLSARSLENANFPHSWNDAVSWSRAQWVNASPIMACVAVCIVIPFALLYGESRRVKRIRQAYTIERKTPGGAHVSNSITKPQKNGQKSEAQQAFRLLGDFCISDADVLQDSYYLTREALLRGSAFCYLMGFLVSGIQHRALWGSMGLSPLQLHGQRPTPVFDYLGFGDWQLEAVSWVGVVLSAQMLFGGARNVVVPITLWLMYVSLINLQAPFTYSYGWEWETCEVGFLAIFLCPLFSSSRYPDNSPPPRLVIWLFRWAAFRLLLGAGMSKIGRNSSACWSELTCTTTHYFTQPIPNPLSWHFHWLPHWVHHLEVEEKFPKENFRVNREMRDEILVYDLFLTKI
jgi:hypothetical protein